MKYRIFNLIIMIVLLINISCEQESSIDDNSDINNPYLGTKVKTTKTYSVSHKFDEKVDSLVGIEVYNYDKKGNMIEYLKYDNNNSLLEKDTRKYNSQGNMTEYLNYDVNGSLVKKQLITFDSLGSMKDKSTYFPQEPEKSNRIVMEKDTFSNHKIRYEYNLDGDLTLKTVYVLDTLNQYIGFEYNSDGILKSKVVSSKDTLRNIGEMISYDSDNNISFKTFSKYDKNNHTVETKRYDSENTIISMFTNKYDSNGNQIEMIFTYGRPKWNEVDRTYELKYEYTTTKHVYKYDDRNRIVEEKIYLIKKIFNQEELELTKKEISEYEDY